MGISRVHEQSLLLVHCLFTCVYFPGILILLKYNESLYTVGSFKFLPILTILMFAEVVKLVFSTTQKQQQFFLGRADVKPNARSKKSWLKAIKDLFKFSIVMLILFAVYYIMVVLFGAALFSHLEETSVLSLTLATLTFVPGAIHLGIDMALLVLTSPNTYDIGPIGQAISFHIKTTVLGAWLGAIAIPLDWDRPWQVWPIPCVLGALVGYMLGHLYTLIKTLTFLRSNRKAQR
ncbi:phosphatidylinositol-glycan biosynthesis class F protein [Venturia canescens]|uniref:phosphatidylinositol-glycan biosynthesis class F protein n=1 Tax=Venturia canescens TaxID=32260 RepID=UPI001C9C7C6D|nr:phosphatidylinositol-glycan biosynthesis class F protein [Venturia canescens]